MEMSLTVHRAGFNHWVVVPNRRDKPAGSLPGRKPWLSGERRFVEIFDPLYVSV
jgi:hypothetical protein